MEVLNLTRFCVVLQFKQLTIDVTILI